MQERLRLTILLLVVAAVLVSGCGSSRKASSTSSANTSAGTGASPAQTVPRGASARSQHTKKPAEPKPAEASPGPHETAAEARENLRRQREREADVRAAGTPSLGAAEADLPLHRRYPKELQGKFLRACKRARGSTSTCECIIARQEANLRVERGQTLAELLALEIAFEREHATLQDIRHRRVRSPRLVRRTVRECV